MPFPGQPDRYPQRDEAVAYLHSYAAHFALPIVTGMRVVKVERSGRFFRVITGDKGCFRARTIAAGQPDRRPMFERFTTDGLIWSDGRHEKVDAVIFATGYRPHLAYLAELSPLDETGRARQRRGASTTVPGLYYVGLTRQRNAASATLRGASFP